MTSAVRAPNKRALRTAILTAAIGAAFAGAASSGMAAAPAGADPEAVAVRTFLGQIYARYRKGPPNRWSAYLAPVDATVFDGALVRMLREDNRLNAGDEPGYADADVFCECQDSGGLQADIRVVSVQGGHAGAVVVIRNAPDPTPARLEFRLVQEAGGWRISDIISSRHASFRQSIADDLKQSRRRADRPRG